MVSQDRELDDSQAKALPRIRDCQLDPLEAAAAAQVPDMRRNPKRDVHGEDLSKRGRVLCETSGRRTLGFAAGAPPFSAAMAHRERQLSIPHDWGEIAPIALIATSID